MPENMLQTLTDKLACICDKAESSKLFSANVHDHQRLREIEQLATEAWRKVNEIIFIAEDHGFKEISSLLSERY